MLIILNFFVWFYVQDRLTRGPCFCRCCSASPLRCGFLCTTLQTWGGCCGFWSLSASTRPLESSTSKSTCLTTVLLSAGMLMPREFEGLVYDLFLDVFFMKVQVFTTIAGTCCRENGQQCSSDLTIKVLVCAGQVWFPLHFSSTHKIAHAAHTELNWPLVVKVNKMPCAPNNVDE